MPNPFMVLVQPALQSPITGWESISSAHKARPDYLVQAQERRDRANETWLALTDVEPLPYEEINAAFERLRQAEEEYSAAWERWNVEKAAQLQTQF